MAPTAVSATTVPSISKQADLGPDGPVLVIGSLGTAQTGKYQSLITNLTNPSGDTIERQILDRLIGGGSVISSLTSDQIQMQAY